MAAALLTETVALNEPPAVQYDLMADLLHSNMFKVYSNMLRSDSFTPLLRNEVTSLSLSLSQACLFVKKTDNS